MIYFSSTHLETVPLTLQPLLLSPLGLFGIRLREPVADWRRRDRVGGQQQDFAGPGRDLCRDRGRSGRGGGARSLDRNGAHLQVAHEKLRLVHSWPAKGSEYVLARPKHDGFPEMKPNLPPHEYGGKNSPSDACFQMDREGRNSCFCHLFIK